MAFLICEKHGKNEKTGNKALASGHICMNKLCPQAFKIFCSGCKTQHRDHSDKTLTLEDVSFLLGRLLKCPSKQMSKPLSGTLQIMKKLKFIKQFRKKIDILEREIQKYCLELITQTESILIQYSTCKQNAINLQHLFAVAQKPQNYKQLLESIKYVLKRFDYNSKKDKFEFGNAQIKEKQDRRKKTVDSTKRKIQEVRDYSMKIIEVVFHNEDSEDEQEDTAYKKKHYQVLKAQLYLKNQEILNESLEDLRNSRSTASKSIIKRDFTNQESQTELPMYTSQELNAKIQEKIAQLKHSHSKSQIDFRQKLHAATRQRENMSRQLTRLKQKFDEKRKSITHIETQLRYNRGIRSQNLKKRQVLMNKFIEIWPMRCPDNEDKND